MLDLASAEMSVTASKTFGMPFSMEALEKLLAALLDAYHGKGTVKPDGSDLMQSIKLDEDARREVFLRRFRMQSARAARQTAYYGDLFARLGLDTDRLTWDDIAKIPLTHKDAVRDRPYDFVCRDAKIVFHTTTTGTTGKPTYTFFSADEIQGSILRSAIGNIMIRDFMPEDVAVLCFSSRATLGNTTNSGAMARIGTLEIHAGQVDPALTLAMIAEEHHLPGKQAKVAWIAAYSSYLGELVETGLRLGYKPSDFALRRIDFGGEITTAGLRRRVQQVFGQPTLLEVYGITETWPMGGEVCSQGHLHYGANTGLWEFINPDTGQPAKPGEIATIVGTPLPPYREAMLVIRYDTQDVVRVLEGDPTCEQAGTPAVSPLLGKLRLSVRHEHGWTFPREVIEALEAVDEVPLPARCGFWAAPGGVAVEVVARGDLAAARRVIGESLEMHGVPLKELYVREDGSQLERPIPLRCDLRELSFSAASPRLYQAGLEAAQAVREGG